PKSVRWLDDDTRFARPVRWLVALLGDRALPVTAFGLTAGNQSMGHRFLARGNVVVRDAASYTSVLEGVKVLADRDARAAMLRSQVDQLARGAGGRVVEDAELFEINTDLVEWPTAFMGRFDARYLDLPREVIVTALRE